MKFIDSVKQMDGPGGTIEIWSLENKMILKYTKDKEYYHLFLSDKYDNELYTKSIFDKLNHPYNNLVMEYGSFFPPKIKMEHKYFNKFIEILENINVEDLKPDLFCG